MTTGIASHNSSPRNPNIRPENSGGTNPPRPSPLAKAMNDDEPTDNSSTQVVTGNVVRPTEGLIQKVPVPSVPNSSASSLSSIPEEHPVDAAPSTGSSLSDALNAFSTLQTAKKAK